MPGATLDLTLTHDGTHWVGRNADLDIHVKGESLGDLDTALMHALSALPNCAGQRVEVVMRFDNATIPTWIRQYAAHYFNRIVELDLTKIQEQAKTA